VQGILQVPEEYDYDYLIYTNSDISLIESFYTKIRETAQNHSYDIFTVNQRTIPQRLYKNRRLSSHNLSFIEKRLLLKGLKHRGTDCFVFHYEILQRIQLGDLFIGHPPWNKVLRNVLTKHVTKDFKTF
jgi:hypothetical protein